MYLSGMYTFLDDCVYRKTVNTYIDIQLVLCTAWWKWHWQSTRTLWSTYYPRRVVQLHPLALHSACMCFSTRWVVHMSRKKHMAWSGYDWWMWLRWLTKRHCSWHLWAVPNNLKHTEDSFFYCFFLLIPTISWFMSRSVASRFLKLVIFMPTTMMITLSLVHGTGKNLYSKPNEGSKW